MLFQLYVYQKISCNEKIGFVKRIKSIYIRKNLILIVLQHTYNGNKLVAFISPSGFGIRNKGVGLLNRDFLNKCYEQFNTMPAKNSIPDTFWFKICCSTSQAALWKVLLKMPFTKYCLHNVEYKHVCIQTKDNKVLSMPMKKP